MAEVTDEAKKCPECNGRQWLYECKEDDEETLLAVPCICLQRELFRSFLIKGSRGSRDIVNADHVKSPLYTSDRDGTQENLLLRCSWETACRHLKWALSAKYRQSNGFFFRVVDDDLLLQVWLGKKAYRARAAGVREDVESFNDLADLLEDPALVIIRLGIAQRNRALGDVLGLALGIRDRVSKPTWVVEDGIPYLEDHPNYTDNTYNHLVNYYTTVELKDDEVISRLRKARQVSLDDAVREAHQTGEISMDDEAPSPLSFNNPIVAPRNKPRQFSNQPEPEPDTDLEMFGDDSPLTNGGSKKKKGKYKK